jgi:hypothetical protein
MTSRSFVTIVVALLTLAGCATRAPILPPPQANFQESLFSGSALTGPTTRPVQADRADQAFIASVRLLGLDRAAASGLEPLEPDVRLIVSPSPEGALESHGELTRRIRWASGDSATRAPGVRSVDLMTQQCAIPRGATWTIGMTDRLDASRGFQIILSASPSTTDELTIAIALADRITAEGNAQHTIARETAVLKPSAISAATPVSLLVPFKFSKSQVQAVLALLEIRPAIDNAEDAKLLADAKRDLNEAVAALGAPPGGPSARWSGFTVALDRLHSAPSRRSSLAYLCDQTRASICEDLALVGDDAALEAVAANISTLTSTPEAMKDDAAFGWLLDRAALDYAAKQQAGDSMPPELLALLIRHTGQVGMNSGSVGETLTAAKNRAEFDARILAENLIYLEDTSPAARVRAFDWLAARGKAPAGYDPLAPAHDRQLALEKLYDAMSAPASHNGSQP